MKTDGVIFDMDGTILDSMGLWLNAGVYYVESLGLKAEPDLGEKMMEMNMIQGASYLQQAYNISMSQEKIIAGINLLLKKYYAERLMPKPGAVEFLQFLKNRNIPFCLATNTDRELFEPCLNRLGLTELFSSIFTCSELNTNKASPIIFNIAAESMNASPENTCVFEDSLYALKTAFNAGFQTAGIYDKYTQMFTDQKKIRRYSTYYCNDYNDVMKLFSSFQSC